MNDPKRSADESARRTCNLLPSCKWASRHVVHPLKLSKVIECEPPRSPSQARHGEAHFGIELHGVGRSRSSNTLPELTSIASPLLLRLRISHPIIGQRRRSG